MGRFIDPDDSIIARLDSADWVILLIGAVIFVVVAFISTGENALAVSATWGVLASVVAQQWRSGKDPRLWVVAVVAVIQMPVAFVVHIPRLRTGMICMPFVVIEGLALWGLLNWIDRRFPRSADAGSSTAH